MIDFKAYWNSSKLCWEIMLEEAQGDRFVKVFRHANTAHKMLKEQGVKFIEARMNAYSRSPMLLIADPAYWVENESDIIDWFTTSNVKYYMKGMILEFESDADKMMFLLRWS